MNGLICTLLLFVWVYGLRGFICWDWGFLRIGILLIDDMKIMILK